MVAADGEEMSAASLDRALLLAVAEAGRDPVTEADPAGQPLDQAHDFAQGASRSSPTVMASLTRTVPAAVRNVVWRTLLPSS